MKVCICPLCHKEFTLTKSKTDALERNGRVNTPCPHCRKSLQVTGQWVKPNR